MIALPDAVATIRKYLHQRPHVVALAQRRIWGGRVYPPKGYKPEQGAAIVFQIRGGSLTYENDHIFASTQVKCYGVTEVDANELYRALITDTHADNGVSAEVRHVELEGVGSTLEEPESEWRYVLCYLNFMIRVPGGLDG